MSDTESSISIPTDETLREALRLAVAEVYKSGDLGELTVKRIRAAAEQNLDLPSGFFKGDFRWKGESDRVIKEETEAQESVVASSPAAKLKAPAVRKTELGPTTKRASRAPQTETARPKKRQKTATPISSESNDSALSSPPQDLTDGLIEEQPPSRDRKSKGELSDEKKLMSVLKTEEKGKTIEGPATPKIDDDSRCVGCGNEIHEHSESEMSEVLDEVPPSKKKGQKAPATSKKEKKPVKTKPKDDANIDPQEAEIKRLQSWLLKCGIRKMWYKELAPYTSPKAKINHLKSMLKDAGMDGRYSVEKAKQIKEDREFKAELEAVQEGAKQWGETTVTEEDERKPRRRLAKGLKELDFLGDDEGEETD